MSKRPSILSRRVLPGIGLVGALVVGVLTTACIRGGDGGGAGATTAAPAGETSQLYVSGNTGGTLLSFNDANSVSGSTAANRIVAGGFTTLNAPRGIAVDMPRNQIYVTNYAADSILVFHGARTVTGGAAPDRMITGAPLSRPSAAFMDATNDRLYVANTGGNSVLVYDNASTLNGGVAPTRTLTGAATALNAPTGIYVDTTRNLDRKSVV